MLLPFSLTWHSKSTCHHGNDCQKTTGPRELPNMLSLYSHKRAITTSWSSHPLSRLMIRLLPSLTGRAIRHRRQGSSSETTCTTTSCQHRVPSGPFEGEIFNPLYLVGEEEEAGWCHQGQGLLLAGVIGTECGCGGRDIDLHLFLLQCRQLMQANLQCRNGVHSLPSLVRTCIFWLYSITVPSIIDDRCGME